MNAIEIEEALSRLVDEAFDPRTWLMVRQSPAITPIFLTNSSSHIPK